MTKLIDTHAHLYAKAFDADRKEMVARALLDLSHLFLPNVDLESIEGMHALAAAYPQHCFAMMGLHPCSVDGEWKATLAAIESHLRNGSVRYYGIGETGLDYYWDKTWVQEQKLALEVQANWAKEMALPLILHCRDSMDDVIAMMQQAQDGRLRGIFHCFTGTALQAQQIIDAGFLLGIGGVVTYKNSGLAEALAAVPLSHLVLETDAPYLTPVPYRGKRNESAYIRFVAEKLSEIKEAPLAEVARITSANALQLFGV